MYSGVMGLRGYTLAPHGLPWLMYDWWVFNEVLRVKLPSQLCQGGFREIIVVNFTDEFVVLKHSFNCQSFINFKMRFFTITSVYFWQFSLTVSWHAKPCFNFFYSERKIDICLIVNRKLFSGVELHNSIEQNLEWLIEKSFFQKLKLNFLIYHLLILGIH